MTIGTSALADQNERFGISRSAKGDVVDEPLPGFMPQFHFAPFVAAGE